MDHTVSVTELDEFEQCPMRWHYHRQLGLVSLSPKADQLRVGGAAHKLLETAILVGIGEALDVFDAVADEFELSIDQKKSVNKILGGVPEWMWNLPNPQSEEAILVKFGETTLSGRPDLWFVDEDGIHVIEFKTTSTSAASKIGDYSKRGLQLRRYATMLYMLARQPDSGFEKQWPLGAPVYSKYVVVDYRGRSEESQLMPMCASEAAFISDGILATLNQMAAPPVFRFGFLCDFCPYWPIDEVLLTGGDGRDIIDTQFEVKSGTK